jgi:hypothetical protein
MSGTEPTSTECDSRVLMALRGELDVMEAAHRGPAVGRGGGGVTVAMLSGDLDIAGAALVRYPVTHSPAVAATAGDVRRLFDSGPLSAERVMNPPGRTGLIPV